MELAEKATRVDGNTTKLIEKSLDGLSPKRREQALEKMSPEARALAEEALEKRQRRLEKLADRLEKATSESLTTPAPLETAPLLAPETETPSHDSPPPSSDHDNGVGVHKIIDVGPAPSVFGEETRSNARRSLTAHDGKVKAEVNGDAVSFTFPADMDETTKRALVRDAFDKFGLDTNTKAIPRRDNDSATSARQDGYNRRMRGVAGLLAIAACGETGVVVEVRVDETARQVELFLGTTACPNCFELTPKSSNVAVPGRVLYRDVDEPLTALVDDDGSAWFRFATSPELIQGLVAVATNEGSDQPVAVAIVDDLDLTTTRRIVIETEPAEPWKADASVQDAHGALLWPAGQCVAAADQMGTTTFVVRQDDPDCDAVEPSLECDAFTYLADQSARETLCATAAQNNTIPFPGDVCVLGRRESGCVDGVAPSTGCTPAGPVVGPRVCDCGDGELAGCLRDSSELHVECTFKTSDNEDVVLGMCPDNSPSGRAAQLTYNQENIACIRSAGFARFAVPPTQDTFSEMFQPFSGLPFGELQIFPQLPPNPGECVLGLQWSIPGPKPAMPTDADAFMWLVSDMFEKPLLVPATFKWERNSKQCNVPSTCRLVGDPLLPP